MPHFLNLLYTIKEVCTMIFDVKLLKKNILQVSCTLIFLYKQGTIFPEPQLYLLNHENQLYYMHDDVIISNTYSAFVFLHSFFCISMFCFQRVHETVYRMGTLRIKNTVG